MKGKVTATKLNVRKSPSRNGIKIGSLPQNALVDILNEKEKWLEINYNGQPAFVHGDFIEPVEKIKSVKGKVKPAILNVRSKPSLDGKKLGTLSQNTVVEVVSEQPPWLKISFNNQTAFVHGDFIELLDAGSPKKGKVTANVLNVRRQPSLTSEKAGTLMRESPVEIIGQISNWLEIKFNGSTAYVHGDFVETEEDKIAEAETKEDAKTETKPTKQRATRFLYQDPDLQKIPLPGDKPYQLTGSGEQKKVAQTWNEFGNLLAVLSDLVQVDIGSAIAVLCVESGGHGFGSNNKMIIRFENHKFWGFWGKNNASVFNKHFKYKKGEAWKEHFFRPEEHGEWQEFHGNQKKEWMVLDFARGLDDTAALKSISMGAPQIMGFNHEAIGYKNVQEMFEKFSQDIRFHIFGLFDLFDQNMLTALRNKDFVKFASFYNGSGQAPTYGKWIQNHFEAFEKLTA